MLYIGSLRFLSYVLLSSFALVKFALHPSPSYFTLDLIPSTSPHRSSPSSSSRSTSRILQLFSKFSGFGHRCLRRRAACRRQYLEFVFPLLPHSSPSVRSLLVSYHLRPCLQNPRVWPCQMLGNCGPTSSSFACVLSPDRLTIREPAVPPFVIPVFRSEFYSLFLFAPADRFSSRQH